ncbi:hypothetical protein K8942_00035 [Candidatus Peribacteria bacterium]|nr:MAG: hypothetical protein K8942_00035 [Candidatus Peribacteria bacterium]
MPDTNFNPADPNAQRKLMEQKRAEWDIITKKREEAIAAEKARAQERTTVGEEKMERDQKAYQAEVAAAQARSREREEWRQGQHTKREEEEQKRKQEAADALLAAEEQKKRDVAEAEKKEYLMNLHRVATAHKIRDKRELIENQAAEETDHIGDIADRNQRLLNEETERALHHLESEKQRKISQTRVDDGRRRKMAEEKTRTEISEAHNEWRKADEAARHMKDRTEAGEAISTARFKESQAKMRIESEHKRDILLLDEQLETKLFTIDQEHKHLKEEILKNAATKKLLIERQEDKKKQEVERRKDNFEKWLKEG